MKKVKLPTANAVTVLEDLNARLAQFFTLADHATVSDPSQRQYHEGQAAAFRATQVLITQLLRRGEIWRGGYDDDAGQPIYSDQVQAILAQLDYE